MCAQSIKKYFFLLLALFILVFYSRNGSAEIISPYKNKLFKLDTEAQLQLVEENRILMAQAPLVYHNKRSDAEYAQESLIRAMEKRNSDNVGSMTLAESKVTKTSESAKSESAEKNSPKEVKTRKEGAETFKSDARSRYSGKLELKESESESGLIFGIKESVESALQYNPNIKAFQEYRQAAEFDRKRARSGFLPNVTGRAGFGVSQWSDTATRSGNSDKDPNDYYSRADASLLVTQTIWDGKQALSRYRITDSMLSSAEERLVDNAEAISLEAILAHIEVFRQMQLVALSVDNVDNHTKILSSQIDRHGAGVSSMADVSQTRARLARSESSLVESRMALEVARSNYTRITGRKQFQLEAPTAPSYEYPSLKNALANSMTNNSKVLAKKSDIDTAYAQKELDKSAFSPRVYLEAGPNYRWRAESSNSYAWGNSVMLRTEWNLYNGGYDWYNLKGNKARIRQAKQELQALRDNLAQETSTAWNQWVAAREQVKFFKEAVIHNVKTRDMYLDQFNVGQRSLLDVLDSENELYSSSMLLISAQMNEIAAQYKLLTLSGKLLQHFDIERDSLKIKTDQLDFGHEDLN